MLTLALTKESNLSQTRFKWRSVLCDYLYQFSALKQPCMCANKGDPIARHTRTTTFDRSVVAIVGGDEVGKAAHQAARLTRGDLRSGTSVPTCIRHQSVDKAQRSHSVMLRSLLLTVPLIQSLVRQVPTLMPCGPAQAQPYGQRLRIQLLGVTLGEASEAATLTTNQSRSWEHETGQAAVPPHPH